MAQTFTDAFAAIEAERGSDFDLAVGYENQRQEHPATPEAVRAAWQGFTAADLHRMARQLVSIVSGADLHAAEEAIQDTYVVLWVDHPELFVGDPRAMLGVVSNYARKRLMKVRNGPRMLSLNLAVDPKSDADPEREGSATMAELSPAVAYFKAGVDEDARFTLPPEPGEEWNRLQAIGAAQRWRDATGKAPKQADLKTANGMPTPKTLRRLGWATLNDLLLESGVPIETPGRHRRESWTPISAAEACYAARKRLGYWPGDSDRRDLPPGSLPHSMTMMRYFGGSSPERVQLGCEAILGPIDCSPEPTNGELTRQLRGELAAAA